MSAAAPRRLFGGVAIAAVGLLTSGAIARAASLPKPLEEQAARHLVTIVRVQRAFFEQKGHFAADLTELSRVGSGWPDPPVTGTYRYGTAIANGRAIVVADPTVPDLRGLKAELRVDASGRIDGRLCITAAAGQPGETADRRFTNADRPCEFPAP